MNHHEVKEFEDAFIAVLDSFETHFRYPADLDALLEESRRRSRPDGKTKRKALDRLLKEAEMEKTSEEVPFDIRTIGTAGVPRLACGMRISREEVLFLARVAGIEMRELPYVNLRILVCALLSQYISRSSEDMEMKRALRILSKVPSAMAASPEDSEEHPEKRVHWESGRVGLNTILNADEERCFRKTGTSEKYGDISLKDFMKQTDREIGAGLGRSLLSLLEKTGIAIQETDLSYLLKAVMEVVGRRENQRREENPIVETYSYFRRVLSEYPVDLLYEILAALTLIPYASGFIGAKPCVSS